MEFFNFVMALSPIVVVLVGILAFHQSAKKVAPIALVWTLILAFTYFNVTGATVDQIGNESNVMKKTLKAFAVILVMYMVLAMLYTCVLFPTFGM